jgi:hypothetical protein
MIEQRVDILSSKVLRVADAICFTSCGVVTKSGELVMGAGIAKQFATKWPFMPEYFGTLVKFDGSRVCAFHYDVTLDRRFYVISFPTKHHFKDKSDLKLIIKSAEELVKFCDDNKLDVVYLPSPGTGLGGLDWESVVKPSLEKILDDRFIITTF